jgi:hypothetical protein
MKETPRPFETQGTGAKNAPRQYRALTPRPGDSATNNSEGWVAPWSVPDGGSTRGNPSRLDRGAGDDRYTR